MEEIKVGEYVRTKSGNIGKVLDITNVTMQKRKKYLIKCNISKAYYVTAIRIVKHSPNIIDLIEVGDYVNGCRVTKIENGEITEISNWFGVDWGIDEIKTIVTKEQFNQVKYEV